MVKNTDVAEKSGVSLSTVSRVLNHPELVQIDTRTRVLEVIQNLGYSPNLIARGLATGNSGLVALLVPDISDSSFGILARGCFDYFSTSGLTLALYNSDESLQKETEILKLVAERQIEGVIIFSNPEEVRTELPKIMIPKVYIQRKPHHTFADSVFIDNKQAAYIACEHLLNLGHKKIGIITGPLYTLTGRELLSYFTECLEKNGIALDEEFIIEGNYKADSGEKAARQFLSLANKPTAIFVCSDITTYSFMATLQSNGIRIPDELSIISNVDLPMSAFTYPKLTTIHSPVYEQGLSAAKFLFDRLSNPKRPARKVILPVTLIIRESTGIYKGI